MFHKRSWPCTQLAAKGRDRGYHSLFTSFCSALHGDVTFHVLAKGLMIRLPELHPPKQFPEPLGQGGGERTCGALAVGTFSQSAGIYARLRGSPHRKWPGYFPKVSVMKDKKKELRSCSRLRRIKEA